MGGTFQYHAPYMSGEKEKQRIDNGGYLIIDKIPIKYCNDHKEWFSSECSSCVANETRTRTLEDMVVLIPTLSWYSPKGDMVIKIDDLLKAIKELEG